MGNAIFNPRCGDRFQDIIGDVYETYFSFSFKFYFPIDDFKVRQMARLYGLSDSCVEKCFVTVPNWGLGMLLYTNR